MQADLSPRRRRLGHLLGELALWLLAMIVALPLITCCSTAYQLLQLKQPVRRSARPSDMARQLNSQSFFARHQGDAHLPPAVLRSEAAPLSGAELSTADGQRKATHRQTASRRVSFSVSRPHRSDWEPH
jgi:hypothetical protein